jgi:hypothetical protein
MTGVSLVARHLGGCQHNIIAASCSATRHSRRECLIIVAFMPALVCRRASPTPPASEEVMTRAGRA